ncbi:unnamed protein product [Rotaria sordida]|uniref:Pentapeptide repeat-containing protein n=1 Tax=Rotaria sordida TaxID=392033 RepID=A0A814C4J9_9BILA|nr:unnamed protein product [Rotaria sordida]CAF1082828.1 unnamed protein product [Rotaria sordida]
MATAPPVFFDPAQFPFTMPNVLLPPPVLPPPPPPPAPPAPSKSSSLDVLKILIGLLIVLILGAILAVFIFLPRTSNQTDLRESNEKIAKLLSDSNKEIARLQREQILYIENERQRRQENLIEKHRVEDRLFEQQRYERQLSIENQRLERQYNLTEIHRSEDRSIEQQQREQDLKLAIQQLKQQFETEEKRLQILLEEKQSNEQRRKNDINKEYTELLTDFIDKIMSAQQPLNITNLELKVRSLIRRFDSLYKSLLIRFLYKSKLLYVQNADSPTLDLQGANLKNLDLDDMDVEFDQIGRWLNYTQLSLPLTNLINASFEQIYLNKANFSWCNMTGTSFHGSQIIQTDFYRAYLSLTNFIDTNVFQSNFSYATIRRASFRNANLSQAYMHNADLESTDFQDIIAFQTDFSESKISSADFRSANLFQAQMVNVFAQSTNFHTAKAMQTNFSYAYMPDCIFQWADLTDASFRNTFLGGANFENANVVNVDFTGANLISVKITPGQLNVVLSIAQAILPDGSKGKNRNLVHNGNASCTGISGTIANWNSNGDVFTKQDEFSTDECVFQARKINATLQQTIDVRRYERLIENGRSKIYLEMQEKAAGTLNLSNLPAYINVRFIDSNNNQIGLEQSTLHITLFTQPSTFIATIPCPSTTVELQLTIVFQEANATVDNIYVTIE